MQFPSRNALFDQALQTAPPPKVEKVHDNMVGAFDNIAKEAEKYTPLALMSAGTKVSHFSAPFSGKDRWFLSLPSWCEQLDARMMR